MHGGCENVDGVMMFDGYDGMMVCETTSPPGLTLDLNALIKAMEANSFLQHLNRRSAESADVDLELHRIIPSLNLHALKRRLLEIPRRSAFYIINAPKRLLRPFWAELQGYGMPSFLGVLVEHAAHMRNAALAHIRQPLLVSVCKQAIQRTEILVFLDIVHTPAIKYILIVDSMGPARPSAKIPDKVLPTLATDVVPKVFSKVRGQCTLSQHMRDELAREGGALYAHLEQRCQIESTFTVFPGYLEELWRVLVVRYYRVEGLEEGGQLSVLYADSSVAEPDGAVLGPCSLADLGEAEELACGGRCRGERRRDSTLSEREKSRGVAPAAVYFTVIYRIVIDEVSNLCEYNS